MRPARRCTIFSLTFLSRHDIEDEVSGLTEPSGLALGHNGEGLWTVSDDTKRVFRLTLDGELKNKRSFEVPDEGLEGITLDSTGEALFTVREEGNEVIHYDFLKQEIVGRRALADMEGYAAISQYFADDVENKGLEGITWNACTQSLFLLDEGKPGHLIEVSADLGSILSHRVLDASNGFVDPGMDSEKVDFSGICHDPLRSAFWIVSDKARRLYLYDNKANMVLQSAPLSYSEDGEYREIEKAEGIAYDPKSGRLYIVSDKEAKLYVYDVRN